MDRKPGHLSSAVKTKSDARRIKILSLGDPAVGKSCLIKRYCEGRFIQEYVSTIGIDYGVKGVNLEGIGEVKVSFWDTAGAPTYLPIRNEFYKDTHGVILVYDVADASSFDSLPVWMDELRQYSQNATPLVIFIIGNKLDLTEGGGREVEKEKAEDFAKSIGAGLFETSCLSGEGVVEMFEELFKTIVASENTMKPQE